MAGDRGPGPGSGSGGGAPPPSKRVIANVVASTPGSRVPTRTILPSDWSAMPLAMSVAPRFSVCLPSPEKVVSSAPSGS